MSKSAKSRNNLSRRNRPTNDFTLPLAIEEWHFEETVPLEGTTSLLIETELNDCYEYEFAREHFFRKNKIARNTPETQFSRPWAFDIDLSQPVQNKFRELYSSDFPTVPWLAIPELERKRRSDILKQYDPYLDSQPIQPHPIRELPAGAFKTRDSSFTFHSPLGYTLVSINQFRILWRYSNEEIINEFSEWLTRQRKLVRGSSISTGRGLSSSLRACLKQLGAYRLRNASGTAPKASVISQQRLGHPIYSQASKWSTAASSVTSILDSWENPACALRETLRDLPSLSELDQQALNTLFCASSPKLLRSLLPLTSNQILNEAKLALLPFLAG